LTENPPFMTVNTHLIERFLIYRLSSLGGPISSLGHGKPWTRGDGDTVRESN